MTTYILSLEGDNEDELGVFEIANTDSPAIKMKGVAFSSQEKKVFFTDDLKMRIASPVLIPMDVYRRDDETGEESYYRSTPDFVEQSYMKFMQNRVGKDVFNEEHDESKRVPSYILETWLVENPKGDKSFTTFGIECPEKTWFAVQQFTDKDVYMDYVKRGLTGFSIHGNANLKLTEQKQTNMLKLKAKKRKIIAHYTDEAMTDSGDLIVAVDELATGEEVVVINPDMEEEENFSGTLETTDGETLVIADGIISEITTDGEAEMTEEEKPVEQEDVVEEEKEVEQEEVVEEEKVVEQQDAIESYTKEEIDAKIQEVMDAFTAKFDELNKAKDEVAETEMTEEDPVQMKMRKIEAIKRASETFKNKK